MITKKKKKLTFKNNTSLRSCTSEINNTFVYNAKDHDNVMLMYSLLEYSENYSMKSGGLWNYSRDKVNDAANGIIANRRINNNKTTSKLFSILHKNTTKHTR